MSISGNSVGGSPSLGESTGIYMDGSSSSTITGNLVGLASDGLTSVPNENGGITIVGGTTNSIGDGTVAGMNVVSGNFSTGLTFIGASDSSVRGNRIGTDAAGVLDRGNVDNGVSVASGSTGIQIGGAAAGQGNLISGNQFNGIQLSASSGTTILGNTIGTKADGSGSLPNERNGIALLDADNNTIGGVVTAGQANTIKHSFDAGVQLDTLSIGNSIRGNSIDQNSGLAIDIEPYSSVTNPPTLSTVTDDGPTATVTGTAGAGFVGADLDIYKSPACFFPAWGPGATYLTTTLAGPGGAFSLSGVAADAGDAITYTATLAGQTTEFSNCLVISGAGGGADLALSTTILGTISVTPGDDLVIPLNVHNVGPAGSPGSLITATLPPEVHLDVDGSGPFTCTEASGGALSCTTGPIASGDDASDSVVLRATIDATRDSPATITFTVTGTTPDPIGANDTTAPQFVVTNPCQLQSPCIWALDPTRAGDHLAVANAPARGPAARAALRRRARTRPGVTTGGSPSPATRTSGPRNRRRRPVEVQVTMNPTAR